MYKKLTTFLVFMMICGFALSAKAITTTSQVNTNKCKNVETRTNQRLSHFQTIKTAHSKAYENLVSRLEKFIDRIKAKGYDTTKLAIDLATLKGKIADFEQAYSDYQVILAQLPALTCQQPNSDFQAKLKEARAQLKIVHQKAADIRDYWRTVIRVDLLAIKKQYPGATSNNTSTSTSSSLSTSSTASSSTTSTSTP